MEKISTYEVAMLGFWLESTSFDNLFEKVQHYLHKQRTIFDGPSYDAILDDVRFDLSKITKDMFTEEEFEEVNRLMIEVNDDADSDMLQSDFDDKWETSIVF